MKNQSATVNLDLRMLELRQEIWDTAQERMTVLTSSQTPLSSRPESTTSTL